MRKRFSVFFLFFALMSITSSIFGQGVTTASMNGIITDDKNEGLPGATIVATHETSGSQYGAATRDDGRFTLPGLRVGGPYTIVASFVGFENQTFKDVYLSLGQNLTLTINMKATATNLTEIMITGKADAVFNSDRTGAALNVSNETIKSIPTISRSITDMTRLSPQSSGNSFGGRNNLYNNLSIDGSVFNNSFGLSGTPGGQTNAQPISLDAIEEIQVSLAPYDVRQSGFTGAGINAITRSGTNEISASVYRFWRNENFVGKKVGDATVTQNNFNQSQQGFRIGGPIIKNKLFYFLNAEMERRDDPATTMIAGRPGLDGTASNVSNVQAADLDALRDSLIRRYNYDPGQYEGYNLQTQNDKFLVRLDYNITNRHKLSLRYNYLKSWRESMPSTSNSPSSSRYPSKSCLPFSSTLYKINNNISSIIGELNSVFGSQASNNLIVGYSAFRDFRSSDSRAFPMVDILNGGTTWTSFGYEQYTANNKLNTDVFQISDNFTYYLGAHTFTVGASFEYFKFANGFTPQFYGHYRFKSAQRFYDNVASADSVPDNYQLQYSAMKGVAVPMAEIEAMQFGFYGQDEWNVSRNMKLTLGLRVDIPTYPVDLPTNAVVNRRKFLDANGDTTKLDVSHLPKSQLMWSPRLGFNYDVFGDKKTQLRGGIGIFTGRIPFVWISNQASNNGVMFGVINESKASNLKNYQFDDDPTTYIPENATSYVPKSTVINATSDDFKFPQVFRTNVAVDQRLPGGIVATAELIYTKDLNAIFHRDANLINPTGKWGLDGRDTFALFVPSTKPDIRRVSDSISNAYVLDNTSEGYSYFITLQLQKSFNFGLDAMFAYTYGKSEDLTSSPGSIASSAFTGNQVEGNPNMPILSYSNYDMRHKIAASISYKKEYLKHFATSVSVIYVGMLGGGGSSNEANSTGKFSYVYSNDFNGDGIKGNDLIYIPKSGETGMKLVPGESISGIKDERTEEQIWADLNAYIEQDDYLSEHRGEIMKRNGAMTPWNGQIDLRFTQDVFLNFSGKKNVLEFTVDILNVGNLINSDWGVKKTVNKRNFLTYNGIDATSGLPKFSFPYFSVETINGNKTAQPLKKTFSDETSINSRWQIQFGIRYIFN